MASVHLTDEQRAFIQPFVPPLARTGRLRADDRRTVEGRLSVLITGCRWRDLPREYSARTTVWRRLIRWEHSFSVSWSGCAFAVMLLVSYAERLLSRAHPALVRRARAG